MTTNDDDMIRDFEEAIGKTKAEEVADDIIRCIHETGGCDDILPYALSHYAEMGVSDHDINTALDVAAKRLADLRASLRLSGKAWLRCRKANADVFEAFSKSL